MSFKDSDVLCVERDIIPDEVTEAEDLQNIPSEQLDINTIPDKACLSSTPNSTDTTIEDGLLAVQNVDENDNEDDASSFHAASDILASTDASSDTLLLPENVEDYMDIPISEEGKEDILHTLVATARKLNDTVPADDSINLSQYVWSERNNEMGGTTDIISGICEKDRETDIQQEDDVSDDVQSLNDNVPAEDLIKLSHDVSTERSDEMGATTDIDGGIFEKDSETGVQQENTV